jgi:hypothetical protein
MSRVENRAGLFYWQLCFLNFVMMTSALSHPLGGVVQKTNLFCFDQVAKILLPNIAAPLFKLTLQDLNTSKPRQLETRILTSFLDKKIPGSGPIKKQLDKIMLP